MVKYPLSTTVQEAFRSALGIADCPQFIDTETPIVPVVVLAQANTPSVSQFFKLTDGIDTLSINTNGSINIVPIDEITSWNAINTVATTSGDVTVGTVPANKKWCVLGWTVSMASAAVCILKLNNITVDICDTSGHVFKNLAKPIVLTAGQTVVRNFSTTATGAVTLIYEEVTV